MKKNSWIALVALIAALAGVAVAVYALVKRSRCALCDSFDDEMLSDDLYADCDCDDCMTFSEEFPAEETEE